MIKRILLSFLATSALSMMAVTLTPEQALQRVSNSSLKMAGRTSGNMKLAYTLNSKTGSPSVYIFNKSDNAGYLLLSADDVAAPILGYVDCGSFDAEMIPPAMKWWLSQYSEQTEYYSSHNAKTYSAAKIVSGGAISPMLKTKWNQGKPFNNQCPQINGINSVTGCVATAMAQVMAYHRYPEVGNGTVSVTVGTTSYSLNLAQEKFAWSNMLDQYIAGQYNQSQADAVAYLMKACGYSVGMSYSTEESGAASLNMGSALINNFGYNKNITYEKRMFYSTTEWEQMVYNELKANRPVLYGGQSEGGGHEFVCDGYDGNGYFHINWGWGGISDGYFLLQSLNPDDLGIGGGTGGGYSFDQDIIAGVQPATTSENADLKLFQYGALTGNKTSTATIAVKATGFNAGWWNMNYSAVSANLGVIIENASNPSAGKTNVIGQAASSSGTQTLSNVTFNPRYGLNGTNGFSFNFPASLGDGTYKVTVGYQLLNGNNNEWRPMTSAVNCPNYFTVVKSGSTYTITWEKAKTLTVVDADLLTPLYLGANAKLSVQLKNNTDVELTETVSPVLYKQGENQFQGSGVSVTLMPGESVTKEFVTSFSALKTGIKITSATTYSLRFYNQDTDSNYDNFKKDVTLNPASSPVLASSDFIVPGATTTKGTSGEDVYLIEDMSNFPLEATVKCSLGYFASEIIAFVFPYTGGSSLTYCEMMPYLFLNAGESSKISGSFHFDSAQADETYMVGLYRYNGSSYVAIPGDKIFIKASSSGVNEIESDEMLKISYSRQDEMLKIEGASGIRRASLNSIDGSIVWIQDGNSSDYMEYSLGNLQPGMYVVVAEDMNGKIHTLKFIK